MGFLRRQPPTPAQLDAISEAARKQRESASKAAALTPMSLGSALGLPVDAAAYILKLVTRVEELERKVASIEAPPHLQNIEQR